MDVTLKTRGELVAAAKMFFDALELHDLTDHPEVFHFLDQYAREHDYMICAEQKGIFGTRLFFGRISTYEP